MEKLKPKVASNPLRFGDLIHKSLAVYYKPGVKRGPRPATTFQRLYKNELEQAYGMGFRDEDGKWHDAGHLGAVMLEGHYDTYHDRDSEFKVISSEQTFQWLIRDPETRKPLVRYVGTFDGVWEHRSDGFLIFPEHKTTAKMPKSFEHLAMDEQASSYWTFGPLWLVQEGILTPDDVHRFRYIWYNFLRKGLPDERPEDAQGHKLNQDGTVSKNQPSKLFHREPVMRDEPGRRIQYARIIAEAKEMREVRRDPSRAYKDPGPLYMPHCTGCGYKDMCMLHEVGADWEAMRDGTMTSWEPYEAHNLDPHGDYV